MSPTVVPSTSGSVCGVQVATRRAALSPPTFKKGCAGVRMRKSWKMRSLATLSKTNQANSSVVREVVGSWSSWKAAGRWMFRAASLSLETKERVERWSRPTSLHHFHVRAQCL